MATKSFEELNTGALTIKNNELPESNTHTLVGGQLVDMVAKEQEINGKVEDLATGEGSNINILKFNPETVAQLEQIGQVRYNPSTQCLEVKLNDEVTLSVGLESYMRGKNADSIDLEAPMVVFVSGGLGANALLTRASNDAVSGEKVIGVITQGIAKNNIGFVATSGIVNSINTSAYAEGDVLWLGTNGTLTNVKPDVSVNQICIGVVLRSHATEGSLLVAIKDDWRGQVAQLRSDLNEIESVLDVSVDGINYGNFRTEALSTYFPRESNVEKYATTTNSQCPNDGYLAEVSARVHNGGTFVFKVGLLDQYSRFVVSHSFELVLSDGLNVIDVSSLNIPIKHGEQLAISCTDKAVDGTGSISYQSNNASIQKELFYGLADGTWSKLGTTYGGEIILSYKIKEVNTIFALKDSVEALSLLSANIRTYDAGVIPTIENGTDNDYKQAAINLVPDSLRVGGMTVLYSKQGDLAKQSIFLPLSSFSTSISVWINGDNRNKLDGKVSENILDIESFDVGFINSIGGVDLSNTNYIISPFIEYKDGVFSCFKENAGSGYFVAYYKADKTFIKRDIQPKSTVIVVDAAVTDCYFIKFSFHKNNINPMANYGSTLLPYTPYGEIYFDENTIREKLSLDKIDIDTSLFATKEETKEFVKGDLINILNPLKFKSGFISQSTGGIAANSDWTYCDEYIPINDGICPFIPKVNNIFIGYYDTSYANVGNRQLLRNTSSQVKATDFPNAVYVRFSWNNSETDISANYGDTYLGYYQYGIAVLPQSNIRITNISSINRSVQKEIVQRGNNVITVGSNNADYTSLRDAVNASVQDQIIFLQAGSYDVGDTRLRLEDRNISIIGEDKTKTIIWNDNYLYGKEPLNINSGYLKNLTIKTIHPEGYLYRDDTLECYAIHIDEGGVNQKLVIEDCDIISYHNAAVGIGLHTNQEIIFRRCNLYQMDKNMTMIARYKKAAMLCHPRAGSDASTAVNQYLRFIDCNMYSRSGYTITLASTDASEMNVEFIRCMTIDEENGHDETKMIYQYAPLKPLIAQGNKLLPSSYGNNCNGLNFDSL